MEVSDADRRKEWSTSQSGMTQTVGTDADIIGVPRSVLAAACYIIRNSEHAESETAKAMRKYALSTQSAELDALRGGGAGQARFTRITTCLEHPAPIRRRRGDMGVDLFGETIAPVISHQSQLPPEANKFHMGNGGDGKHYWLTPPELYAELDAEFAFDFDPCPYPLPEGFDGLTCEWGQSSYVNPPFGSIIHEGKKKGPTAWVRKAITEWQKGKRVVLVYPVDKWVLMLMSAILGDHAQVRNLGDVKWLATEDGSAGKGTGRHIACFILEPGHWEIKQ